MFLNLPLKNSNATICEISMLASISGQWRLSVVNTVTSGPILGPQEKFNVYHIKILGTIFKSSTK